jgi:ubiquitin-protein ligase E3 C
MNDDAEMESEHSEGEEDDEEDIDEEAEDLFAGLQSLLGLPISRRARERTAAALPQPPSRIGDHLAHFTFMGRLLGKALFEGILVAPRFANFVLRRFLGRAATVADLNSLDPELARGLERLLERAAIINSANGGIVDDVAALGLTFTVTDRDELSGVTRVTELCANGDARDVRAANAGEYVRALARHRLHDAISAQARAFLSGLRELIPLAWVRMFNPAELQLLLGGRDDLDVAAVLSDLRANVAYAGGYDEAHPFIHRLWRVLATFSPTEFARFLAFVTSVPRPPLLGFRTLTPRFGIQAMPDTGRLPVASTCFCLLKIPAYPTDDILRDRLLLAIATEGFDLT